MAKINQALIARLRSKLGISQSRIYALIQKSANDNRVRRHIGALLIAGDNGISIQKYASAADHAELRGIPNHLPVAVDPAPAVPPPKAVTRKGKSSKVAKTKENTVFVVHGRDAKLRDAMYEFLGALGLKPQEWGHAIRSARGKGGNPYVNDAVTKVMEQAQALVVILSPDDEAKLKDQFVTKHERQTEGKLRGHRLGNPRNIGAAGVLGRTVQTAAADQFVEGLMPVVQAIRSSGAATLEAITVALNQRGIRSARGGRWHASSVANLLARAKQSAGAAAF